MGRKKTLDPSLNPVQAQKYLTFCLELHRIHKQVGFILNTRKLTQAYAVSKDFFYGLLHAGYLAKQRNDVYLWMAKKPDAEMVQIAYETTVKLREEIQAGNATYASASQLSRAKFNTYRLTALIRRWGIRNTDVFLDDLALVHKGKNFDPTDVI